MKISCLRNSKLFKSELGGKGRNDPSHSASVILLPWRGGARSLVYLITGHFCPCTRRVSANCHTSKVSNFKCKLVGRRNSGHRHWTEARHASKSGTNGSIWWGNYGFFFEPISRRGRRGFLLGLELKNLQRIWISAKKTAFLLRLVQDPDRSKWPAFTSFYERSNSGYAIKPKKQ